MDIAEFIEARLRDDENGARNAAEQFGLDWVEIWSGTVALDGNQPSRIPEGRSGWDAHLDTADSGISRHIVDWDPARVLREVDAKRSMLARHRECADGEGWCGAGGHDIPRALGGCFELRALAAPHADHPQFDKSWLTEDW